MKQWKRRNKRQEVYNSTYNPHHSNLWLCVISQGVVHICAWETLGKH